jgi:hypothetical protein
VQQPIDHEQTRQLYRLEIQFGIAEEKCRLSRGFAAVAFAPDPRRRS